MDCSIVFFCEVLIQISISHYISFSGNIERQQASKTRDKRKNDVSHIYSRRNSQENDLSIFFYI